MNLLRLIGSDPFQVVPGLAPVVVGAPHHGTRPHVDADLGTGPIALALAAQLGGRAVVVSDLRRTVDANKAPLRFDKTVRHHAVRYQNELFHGLPRLVIEIHGHVSGQYALEVTTGFDLDSAAPGDAAFLEKLRLLKEALPGAVASRVGTRPSVGIYPLDHDVRKAATDTFTFQKIRRARNLAGLEWFGLHIELHAELRTSKTARSAAYAEALGAALAQAICGAFGSQFPENAFISTRSEGGADCDTLNGQPFKVAQAPEKQTNHLVILLHPDDLETLGALEGDHLNLCNGSETIQAVAAASHTVRAGHAALPGRLRRQIGLEPRQQVWISHPAAQASPASATQPVAYLAVGEIRPGRAAQVWLSPGEIERIGLVVGDPLRVKDQPTRLHPDPALLPRTLAISDLLAEALTCTLGEVLPLEKGKGAP